MVKTVTENGLAPGFYTVSIDLNLARSDTLLSITS